MGKNFLSVLLLSLVPLGAFAQDFEVDGIYYNVTSEADKTCEVTFSTTDYTGDVDIPSSVENGGTTYSVTSIGDYAFMDCSGLTSVSIPESVTSIGNAAFYFCDGLTSLTIGASVTSIGEQAFRACYSLTSVTIPNSVTSISYAAFSGCEGLKSVTIGTSVTSIGDDAFYGCSGLTSVTIPGSVTSIGADAFSGCSSLTSVTIPGSVTSIGESAFSDCSNMQAINVDTDNLYYSSENGILFNADKTVLLTVPGKTSSVTIPASVTSIGESAFYGCFSLTSVTIPGSVTSIGNYAFESCDGLTSLTIPGSVTSIGDYAFGWCSSLTELVCLAEVPPTCEAYAFDGVDTDNCELVVPEGSVAAYQAAGVWMNFSQTSGIKVYNVPIDNMGYVTRCFADNVDLSGTGLTAYVVSTYDDATAMLTEVTGVVPTGAGVILYAANPGTYSLFPSEADATDANLEGNKLMGVLADTNLDSGTAYVLAADGADGVEFALLSDDTNSDGGNVVPANRAYLPVNATTFAAPQTLSFTFGTPTAIESVTVAADDAEVMWYTLSGVPVKNPSKGIFVNNKGKVVLFK